MKKRILSIILALAMTLSLLPAVSLHAGASESGGSGTLEDPATTTTISTPVDNGNGTATTTTTTTASGTGTNENGDHVTVNTTKTEEVTTDSDGDTISESWTEEGKETTISEKTEDIVEITLDLTPAITPGEETESGPITGQSDPAEPVTTLNADGDTTIITETPREITADVTSTEIITGGDLGGDYTPDVDVGLTPVNPVWTGEESHIHGPAESKIYYLYENADGSKEVREVLYSELTDEQKAALSASQPEGYDYLYIGHGEDSYFGADWQLPPSATNYGTGTSQFQLVDPTTGTIFTGYCADVDTGSKAGYWYKIENLEDADYYKNKPGAEDHIRAIALNGYWGSEGTNADGTPVTGSLAKLKETLYAAIKDNPSGIGLTEEDVDALTEGQALTATQMAIWEFGNPYEDIDLSSSTIDIGSPTWASSYNTMINEGMTDEDIDAALDRINALAQYLMGMSMTAEEAGTTEIINEDKFINTMSITVGEMVKGHANNNDDSDTNDAYNVDLTFSLVVTPSTNDDLIVKVVNGDGQVIKTARIAGDAQDGEGFGRVEADENGNYTLTGLKLIEGSSTEFNLKLEGAQYLEQGVYIYTSEVRDYVGKNGSASENVPSQTFVGIAEGYKSVDMSMSIDLTFHVEEGTVTTERTWKNSGRTDYPADNNPDPTEPDPTDPDPSDPTEPDPTKPTEPESTQETEPAEETSLANPPATGDISLLLCVVSLLSGAGVIGLSRRKDEEI